MSQVLLYFSFPCQIEIFVPFQKSLDECEGEWADNKKIVDLRNKDVRQAVSHPIKIILCQMLNTHYRTCI